MSSFFQIQQQNILFSAGITRLPCFFKKVHYTICLFLASEESVRQLLIGTNLNPVLRLADQFTVAIGLVRYNESDLGSYNEMILAIPVLPKAIKPPLSSWLNLLAPLKYRKMGLHIIHIPVTSAFSRAAGNELWGYPKIVAPVEHEFITSSLQSKVFDPGSNELIVEVKGKLGFGIPSIPLSLITYSFVDGKLFRTPVKVRGIMKLRLKHDLKLHIGSSTHPIANDLRMLGLDGKKPLIVMDTDKFQSVFYKGDLFFAAENGR